jgi:hypothetical protein
MTPFIFLGLGASQCTVVGRFWAVCAPLRYLTEAACYYLGCKVVADYLPCTVTWGV